jgi:hypothetical protein
VHRNVCMGKDDCIKTLVFGGLGSEVAETKLANGTLLLVLHLLHGYLLHGYLLRGHYCVARVAWQVAWLSY